MSDRSELPADPPEPADIELGAARSTTQKLPFVPKGELAREQRERLEQMVDERTAELRSSNERLGREIRERESAEAALQHSVQYQTTINALLNLALKQAPLDVLLQRALDMVLSLPALAGSSAGAIFVAEQPGALTLKVHQGMSEETCRNCAEVQFGTCLCGQAAEAGELMQVTRMEPGAVLNQCGSADHRGHCCLPFSEAGEVLGVLCLLLPRNWVLAEWEIRVLGGVADVLASIISRKRGETKRAELEEQLRYSQKLEAVGRLAGGVAHDFNNLLTVIQGNVYLNLSDPDLPEQLRQDLEGIEDAAKRAATLTRQLLAFGRKSVLQSQETDVNTIVRELEKMLRRVIGEDIELSTSLAEDLWSTEVDPSQLEQVLLALSVNAREAMPRGGSLVLETSNVELGWADQARRAEILPGSYVRVCVRDNGIGMDSSLMEHVFEPFFTTKEIGQGTGLGLATAYGIVRQSGGYIWPESEPGCGTRLVIHLPRMVVAEAPRVEQRSQPAKNQVNTILLVEDEDFVRRLAVRVLSGAGHQVLEAANSARALEISREFVGEIHLLLTDVIMPGQSGNELAEQLRGERPGMKVLFMSGYTGDMLEDRGLLTERLLLKPFTPAELSDTVSALCKESD